MCEREELAHPFFKAFVPMIQKHGAKPQGKKAECRQRARNREDVPDIREKTNTRINTRPHRGIFSKLLPHRAWKIKIAFKNNKKETATVVSLDTSPISWLSQYFQITCVRLRWAVSALKLKEKKNRSACSSSCMMCGPEAAASLWFLAGLGTQGNHLWADEMGSQKRSSGWTRALCP